MKMKFLILITLASLFITCNEKQKIEIKPVKIEYTENAKIKNIPYTVLENYFVKKVDFELAVYTITSQEEFEKYFGKVTTISKNRKPTPIDFKTQNVITVILKEEYKSTTISPKSLQKEDERLILTYTYKHGDIQSFKSRPFFAITMDKNITGMLSVYWE